MVDLNPCNPNKGYEEENFMNGAYPEIEKLNLNDGPNLPGQEIYTPPHMNGGGNGGSAAIMESKKSVTLHFAINGSLEEFAANPEKTRINISNLGKPFGDSPVDLVGNDLLTKDSTFRKDPKAHLVFIHAMTLRDYRNNFPVSLRLHFSGLENESDRSLINNNGKKAHYVFYPKNGFSPNETIYKSSGELQELKKRYGNWTLGQIEKSIMRDESLDKPRTFVKVHSPIMKILEAIRDSNQLNPNEYDLKEGEFMNNEYRAIDTQVANICLEVIKRDFTEMVLDPFKQLQIHIDRAHTYKNHDTPSETWSDTCELVSSNNNSLNLNAPSRTPTPEQTKNLIDAIMKQPYDLYFSVKFDYSLY